MKKIIIFLLLVIIALITCGQYNKYQRFSLSNYEYRIPETIDVNSADKGLLLDYFEAIEAVNGYIITQWSAHDIDVRNPESDNERTKAAVTEYRKKLANVKFYEQQLLHHKESNPVEEISEDEKKKMLIRKQFYNPLVERSMGLGEKRALVFEIQKILIKKGYIIENDGVYRTETQNAIKEFEQMNGLFPDGILDAITLEYLLN